MTRFALDSGPLVAYLNHRDPHHAWATDAIASVGGPLLTCEAVMSEACFLVRNLRGGPPAVVDLAADDIVQVDFPLSTETRAVRTLMAKYGNVPMSLADACLVRMTELDPHLKVITIDRDFLIYRRHGRQTIPVVMP